MANFQYDASLDGRVVSNSLARDLTTALNKLPGLNRWTSHPGFVSTYRVTYDLDQVLVGIRPVPAKMAETEKAEIHFCGDEKNILRAKQYLLKSVGGLELK
ncbi:hypothetical protein KA107_03375 [Candidatus Pacearchaeota archaeon]|nr:hypothetical protein [Candidatus Pacearchaeota archaeon]